MGWWEHDARHDARRKGWWEREMGSILMGTSFLLLIASAHWWPFAFFSFAQRGYSCFHESWKLHGKSCMEYASADGLCERLLFSSCSLPHPAGDYLLPAGNQFNNY